MTTPQHSTAAIVLLMFAGLIAGCDGTTQMPRPATSDESRDTGRLEHYVAAHRPAAFPDAVEQIELRHQRILKELSTAKPVHLSHELQELIDILNWLPEIAGDTDLRKGSWDRVNQHSQQLLTIYEPVAQAIAKGGRPEKSSLDKVAPLISDLKKLVPATVATR